MKVDPKAQVAQAVVARQPFKQLLAEARTELRRDAPAMKVVSTVTSARATASTQRLTPQSTQRSSAMTAQTMTAQTMTAQTMTQARAHANGEAQRLGAVRSESMEVAKSLSLVSTERNEAVEERGVARILEFIVKEFAPDQQARPHVSPVSPVSTDRGPEAAVHHLHPPALLTNAPKLEAAPEAKAAQAVALIERIESFVRSQRPGLTLTLNNSLGAHVEIERMGPREIALKLVGHRGPPSAEAVSRIRDELQARGLKIGVLSVA